MVKVGDGRDHFLANELFHELVAEAFDIHGQTAREVQDRTHALRRAIKTGGAAVRRFALLADDLRTAFRAAVRYMPQARAFRALVLDDTDDFGNDVAGTAHDDGVADAHVLAPQLVFVVQRRVRDGDAAHRHRFQHRDRRDDAGASHGRQNIFNDGGFFLCRQFVGNRPARGAGGEAELGRAPQNRRACTPRRQSRTAAFRAS